MTKAKTQPGEIDLIVVGTASPDRLLPSAAVDLQAALGASRAAAFDVGAACSGFIYGCTVAEGLMASGGYETTLVVGVEKPLGSRCRNSSRPARRAPRKPHVRSGIGRPVR